MDDARHDDAPPPPPAASAGEGAGDASAARLLRRSRDDRVIAGVCGGLGRYLGVDPILVRLAFVALTVAGGAGVLVYLVGWIAIPEERAGEDPGRAPRAAGSTARVVAGAVLVGIGATMLLDRLVPSLGRYVWPLVLIALGLLVLGAGVRR